VPDLDGLRGKEGEASAIYFAVFDHLIYATRTISFFTAVLGVRA